MVQKIQGVAANLSFTNKVQSITLVYADSTKGWINVQNEDTAT